MPTDYVNLVKSLKKNNKYQIIYLNLSRNLSFREITVISIKHNILKAFDSTLNDVRTFNLKRMRIVKTIIR